MLWRVVLNDCCFIASESSQSWLSRLCFIHHVAGSLPVVLQAGCGNVICAAFCLILLCKTPGKVDVYFLAHLCKSHRHNRAAIVAPPLTVNCNQGQGFNQGWEMKNQRTLGAAAPTLPMWLEPKDARKLFLKDILHNDNKNLFWLVLLPFLFLSKILVELGCKQAQFFCRVANKTMLLVQVCPTAKLALY